MMPPPVQRPKSKALTIVLVILGVIVIGCAAGGFFLFQAGAKLIGDATTYAGDTMKAVAKPWKAAELWSRADDAYKQEVSAEKSERYVEMLSARLGPLKSADPFKATSTQASNNNGVTSAMVICDATGHFEKGDGQITMTVAALNGKWGVHNLSIKSPLLTANASPSPESSPEPASPTQ